MNDDNVNARQQLRPPIARTLPGRVAPAPSQSRSTITFQDGSGPPGLAAGKASSHRSAPNPARLPLAKHAVNK